MRVFAACGVGDCPCGSWSWAGFGLCRFQEHSLGDFPAGTQARKANGSFERSSTIEHIGEACGRSTLHHLDGTRMSSYGQYCKKSL